MISSDLDTFFDLLRSGLYGTTIPADRLPATIDWPLILGLARKQTVTGLVIDAISRLPENLRPSSELSAKLDVFAMTLIRSNARLDRALVSLVKFLGDHSICGVLMKGQGVARSYYPMPEMRQCGDIDFYVGKKEYRHAINVCREYLLHDKDEGDVNQQHFHFEIDGVTIELHRLASKIYTPVKGRRFQKWVEEQLEQSAERRTLTLGDTDVTLPPYGFDVIYIFYHAWRHFLTGGIGLRQLCDWTLILHSRYDDIDIPRLEENLRRFGLTKGWKLFGCIAVNHLGLSPDKMPLYTPEYSAKSEKILDEILLNGNFGFYSKAYARTPVVGYGVWHGMGKFRNIFGYWRSLFPVIPVEATFLLLHRLTSGAWEYTVRNIRHFRKERKEKSKSSSKNNH